MGNLVKSLRGMSFFEALAFTFVAVTLADAASQAAERIILATFHGHAKPDAPAPVVAAEPAAPVATVSTIAPSKAAKKKSS